MSTKHLLALLNSIDGDVEQFLSIALQIAAQEARQGAPRKPTNSNVWSRRRAISNAAAVRLEAKRRSRSPDRRASCKASSRARLPQDHAHQHGPVG